MFAGDKVSDINAENWITDKPDLSKGKYLIHFWTSSCIRCHTELEILSEIARHRDISLVILHQPKYRFETPEKFEKLLERKNVDHYAAHKPEKQSWFTEHSPKKLLIEEGRIKYHSSENHNLREISSHLGLGKSLRTPEKIDEKHLGLENSAVHPKQRFHGKKDEKIKPLTRKHLSIAGKWKQTEKYLEAIEDAQIKFMTDKEELYITADPQNSIRDVELLVDSEYVSKSRIKEAGMMNLESLGGGNKQVTLSVDKGLKLYKISLLSPAD